MDKISLDLWKKRVKIELETLQQQERNKDRDLLVKVWTQNWYDSKEHAFEDSNFIENSELKLELGGKGGNKALTTEYSVQLSNGKKQKAPVFRLSTVEPLPTMLSWVKLSRNFAVDDETTLNHIPYVGDEEEPKFLKVLYENYNGNVKALQEKKEIIDDATFTKLVQALVINYNEDERDENSNINVPPENNVPQNQHQSLSNQSKPVANPKKQSKKKEKKRAQQKLAKQLQSPPDIIFEAISACYKDMGSDEALMSKYKQLMSEAGIAAPAASKEKSKEENKQQATQNTNTVNTECVKNIDGPEAESNSRDVTISSFHTLFCRRCFMYDCHLHKLDSDNVPPKLKTTFVPALSKKFDTPCSEQCYMLLNKNKKYFEQLPSCSKKEEHKVLDFLNDKDSAIWTGSDQSLYRVLAKVFPDNYCVLAQSMLTKTCQQVYAFAQQEKAAEEKLKPKEVPPQPEPNSRRSVTGTSKKEYVIGNYHYMPCHHEGPCKADNCGCIASKNYCERFCNCRSTCDNRFPGCRCKSQCNTNRCPCYFAARECDPDLCKGGCAAYEYELEKIKCKNVNMQRGLHKHLLLAKSDVAGWGIFAKEDIARNEFVYEYCGELISHDEAERRGQFYDQIKCSYLFNINEEFCIDATNKGNKIRFANHSVLPNCYAKVLRVNGDHRIGIFALHRIKANEELFFDYRYGPNHRLKLVGNEREVVKKRK